MSDHNYIYHSSYFNIKQLLINYLINTSYFMCIRKKDICVNKYFCKINNFFD